MWELNHKEGLAPKNWFFWTVVLEKTLESPLDCKKIQLVNPKGNKWTELIHWKDWCWSWSDNTLSTWWEELAHWKIPWWWERLKARQGDNRGWDGWMASLTQWTWVWTSSQRWCRTGKPDVLLGVTESWTRLSNWTTYKIYKCICLHNLWNCLYLK